MIRLESPAFRHNGRIPSRYTCDGDNVSPPLMIHDVPEGTQSLALIVEDPDVPTRVRSDGMWNHWILYNIQPNVREIEEGKEPPGMPGTGTHGGKEYYGPCPPDREHRYFFKLFALSRILDLNPEPEKDELEKAMEGHIIEKCELTGLYERS
jgi:Raf kinase inhibitor-like YbhB/YbcL family protein